MVADDDVEAPIIHRPNEIRRQQAAVGRDAHEVESQPSALEGRMNGADFVPIEQRLTAPIVDPLDPFLPDERDDALDEGFNRVTPPHGVGRIEFLKAVAA